MAQNVWHQSDAVHRTAVDFFEHWDQKSVEPVSLNLADIEKVGLTWFEFDAVKEYRVPLNVTRIGPIMNYLRQSILRYKFLVS